MLRLLPPAPQRFAGRNTISTGLSLLLTANPRLSNSLIIWLSAPSKPSSPAKCFLRIALTLSVGSSVLSYWALRLTPASLESAMASEDTQHGAARPRAEELIPKWSRGTTLSRGKRKTAHLEPMSYGETKDNSFLLSPRRRYNAGANKTG